MSSATTTTTTQDHQSNLKKDPETSKVSSKLPNEDLHNWLLQLNLTLKETIESYAENPELSIASIDAAIAEMENLYQQGVELKEKCKFGAIKGRMKILKLIREIKILFFDTKSPPTDTQLQYLMRKVSDTYKFLKRSDTTKHLYANKSNDDSISEEAKKRLELDFTTVQTDLAKLRLLLGRRRNEITDKVSLDKLEAMLEHENLSLKSSILKDLKDAFKKVVKNDPKSGNMIVVEEGDIVDTGDFQLLEAQEFVKLFADWGDIFKSPALNLPIPPKPEDPFIDFDPSDDDFDFSTPTSQAKKKTRTTRSPKEYSILYDEVVRVHKDDATKEKTLKELRLSSQILKEQLSAEKFRDFHRQVVAKENNKRKLNDQELLSPYKKKAARKKWTHEETSALKRGYQKYGHDIKKIRIQFLSHCTGQQIADKLKSTGLDKKNKEYYKSKKK